MKTDFGDIAAIVYAAMHIVERTSGKVFKMTFSYFLLLCNVDSCDANVKGSHVIRV